MDAKAKDKVMLLATGVVASVLVLGYFRLTGRWAHAIMVMAWFTATVLDYINRRKVLAARMHAKPWAAAHMPPIQIQPFARKYVVYSIFLVVFMGLALARLFFEGTVDFWLLPLVLLQILQLKSQNTQEKIDFLDSSVQQA